MQINCDGHPSPFKVVPETGNNVYDLKELIINKRIRADSNILAKNLVLWKVRIQAANPVLNTATNRR